MRYVDHAKFIAAGQIVEAPVGRACHDQNFGLPTGMYVAMAILFAGATVILSLAFSGDMAVSYGVIAAFLTMFFAVPSLFPVMARPGSKRAPRWDQFIEQGIMTATGLTSARSATVLILLLPFLIFCFPIAIAIIAAAV